MSDIELAKKIFGSPTRSEAPTGSQDALSNPTGAHMITGIATSNSKDSADGSTVMVDIGGPAITYDGGRSVEIKTMQVVYKGDVVQILLVGPDGRSKSMSVVGVEGRGTDISKDIDRIELFAGQNREFIGQNRDSIGNLENRAARLENLLEDKVKSLEDSLNDLEKSLDAPFFGQKTAHGDEEMIWTYRTYRNGVKECWANCGSWWAPPGKSSADLALPFACSNTHYVVLYSIRAGADESDYFNNCQFTTTYPQKKRFTAVCWNSAEEGTTIDVGMHVLTHPRD